MGERFVRSAAAAFVTGAMVAALLLLVACGAPVGDRGGGPAQRQVTLSLVTGERGREEVDPFVNAVTARSSRSVTIDVRTGWRSGQPDYERGAIRDVIDGKADLGIAGARAFDTLGITSFQALVAPLLIDSYELQDRALSSPVGEEMLMGLEGSGLVGLDYVPGQLRRPLGITRQLTVPTDYEGSAVGLRDGAVAKMTLEALGARPVVFVPDRIGGLDGMEAHLKLIHDGRYDRDARSLTGDVVLWPRTYVLFANAAKFASLTAAEQALLQDAAGASRTDTAFMRALESEAYDVLCRRGLEIHSAGTSGVEELVTAVAPVRAALSEDASTASFLDQIDALRAELAEPTDVVAPCDTGTSPPPRTTDPSALDGTWEVCVTREEHLAAGADAGEDQPDNIGCFALRFDRGQFWQYRQGNEPGSGGSIFNADGTYELIGENRITFYLEDGLIFDFTWSVFRDTLTFKKTGRGGPTALIVKPFHRADD